MTLALADELFLMTHDIQSGKARLSDPALGIGLSAALLSELVFSGSLMLSNGQLLLGEYPPPNEHLAESLLDETRAQLYGGELTVRNWLGAHRRIVLDLVADRMAGAGELRREEQQRRLGRTVTRFYPLRPAEAFIRCQRISSYLRHRVEITAGDALLAALLHIMAPGANLLELDDVGRGYLGEVVPLLPGPLAELLNQTESAIQMALRNPSF
ncbi:MAG: hypothetical protein QG622_1445 [Actinomycetota bacterium]|nr:hypothetical protein [Actinomycetota bacterium]